MNTCPRCGAPIRVVNIGTGEAHLDATPNAVDGTVLSIAPGVGNFLDGPDLFQARRNPLVAPHLYTRHGVKCPQWWKDR